MRIAVVIPAYNAEAYLAQAIGSVLRQTHDDWSLVLVDDGSIDATLAVGRSFSDPRISIRQQMHAGVSAARNHGAAVAGNADALLFLDADDELQPQALSVLAATLADCPWAVASCGRYARIGRSGVPGRPAASQDGHVLERLLTRNLFANGGHVLIAAGAYALTGGFRCDMHFGEDWEFWVRLALLGEFAAVRDPRPVLHVRVHDAGASRQPSMQLASYRGALDVIYANPALASHAGSRRLTMLRRLAEAEAQWAAGWALLQQGLRAEGRSQLTRSLCQRPTLKRLCLFALAMSGLDHPSWRFASERPARDLWSTASALIREN